MFQELFPLICNGPDFLAQAVSTQMGWRLGPTIATVQGSQGRASHGILLVGLRVAKPSAMVGCTVPTSWAWKFVLVAS